LRALGPGVILGRIAMTEDRKMTYNTAAYKKVEMLVRRDPDTGDLKLTPHGKKMKEEQQQRNRRQSRPAR